MVPVSLRPLEKFEVVLHLALYELFHRDGLVDRMLGEDICARLEADRDIGRADETYSEGP